MSSGAEKVVHAYVYFMPVKTQEISTDTLLTQKLDTSFKKEALIQIHSS